MEIKNKYITITIAIVSCLFGLQLFFIYKLYKSNKDTTISELNIALDLAYIEGLSYRLDQDKKLQEAKDESTNQNRMSELAILDIIRTSNNNTISRIPVVKRTAQENLDLETSLVDSYPFSFEDTDYFITSLFLKRDSSLLYNLIVFNPKDDQIYNQSNYNFKDAFITYHSDIIYLNKEHTRAIQLKAIPNDSFILYMSVLIIMCFIFSFLSAYYLYFQIKIVEKEKELKDVKNNFYSEVSHEMIRSLSILTQTIDSLKIEENITHKEKRNKYIDYADQEILKMAKKTEMVLSLARDDEGVLQLNIKEFDIVKLIYDEADAVLAIPPKDLDIDIDIDSNFLSRPCIFGDKDHLEQVISNLISNAVKYSGDHLDLVIKLWREPNNVYLSVKDNGFGISFEDQIIVFEKYTRVSKNEGLKGHGIGLNYVKRIIEKHNGDINLKSKLGEGSEFIIRLPQQN